MKIYLRIPTNMEPVRELVAWLLWVKDHTNGHVFDIDIHDTRCFGIAEGRNEITNNFLKSDAEWLWIVDADTVPPKNLSILDHTDKYSIIAAPYQGITQKGVAWHVYLKRRDDTYISYTEKNLIGGDRMKKVDACGTGCMLIHRRVFEDRVWEPAQYGSDFKRIWHYGERKKDWTIGTEDVEFCREVGGVWVDTHYICAHMRVANLRLLAQIQNSMDSKRIEMRKAGVKI